MGTGMQGGHMAVPGGLGQVHKEWCVPSPKEVARMMNTAALPSLKRRVGPWKRADHLSGVYDT